MKLTNLTAKEFVSMIIVGCENLTANMELVNSLNVFPVPDGDTGTNMNMTFVSGTEHIRQQTSQHVGELAAALAKGLLMGARGNSGVILSQIFRGFSLAIKDKAQLDANDFAAAFTGGVESAYKAVMKPVEGTILTVAREAAIRGEKKAQKSTDILEVMEAIVGGAKEALDRTPDLLPVLKQVGVVDSGGKGLLCVYEGFLAALSGQSVVDLNAVQASNKHAHAMFEGEEEHPMSLDEITFGYCTEIMVRIGLNPTSEKVFDYESFRNTLNEMGDSLLVVADDEIIKVHIHTENPGRVFQLGQEYGELIKLKVDNMREQVRGLEAKEADLRGQAKVTQEATKDYAIIAVAAGEGVMSLFSSLGVHKVLSGGQTMNPSTEDFVKAIEELNAARVLILPNNKNIIMAAEQATQVVDIPAAVVNTTTIPQGISSMMAFNPDVDLETNQQAMLEMAHTTKSGQITYAIRDTEIDGVMIKKDEFIGLINNKIVLSNPSLAEGLYETLAKMIEAESELITIIVGEDGDQALAESLVERLLLINEELEVEIIQGDQPVYHYIFAVE